MQLEKQTTVGLVTAAIPFTFRGASPFNNTPSNNGQFVVEGYGQGNTVSYVYRMRETQGTVQVPSQDRAVRSTSRCTMSGRLGKYGLYQSQTYNDTKDLPLFNITGKSARAFFFKKKKKKTT